MMKGSEETMAPSPNFSQVFILKIVKVLCFDTLLQVFILKVLADARVASWAERRWAFLRRIRDTPIPGVLLKEFGFA